MAVHGKQVNTKTCHLLRSSAQEDAILLWKINLKLHLNEFFRQTKVFLALKPIFPVIFRRKYVWKMAIAANSEFARWKRRYAKWQRDRRTRQRCLGGWKCRGNRAESPGGVCRRGRGPWDLKGCLCVILVDLCDLSCVLVAFFFS